MSSPAVAVGIAFTLWKRAHHYLTEKQVSIAKRALLAITPDAYARWASAVSSWELDEFLTYCEVTQMETGRLRALTTAELEYDLA